MDTLPLNLQPTSSSQTGMALGLDLGGTKLSGARVSLHEPLQDYQQTHTPESGRALLQAMADLIRALQEGSTETPLAVGIATAGTVDIRDGKILGATGNLPGIRDIPDLKQALETEVGLPVFLENDANAAAYGEFKAGAGIGYSDVLAVTLGTGVGTGVIIHGQLLHGAHFSAGEGGHIAISSNRERLCTCGKWDCWEAYASGTGLAETARRELLRTPNRDFTQLLSGKKAVEDVTTHDVVDAWRSGDPLAQSMIETWHQHIAIGLGSLLNVLDPDITVISGGMAKFVDFTKLTAWVQERAMTEAPLKIVPAVLGNKAGIVGAAFQALERVQS